MVSSRMTVTDQARPSTAERAAMLENVLQAAQVGAGRVNSDHVVMASSIIVDAGGEAEQTTALRIFCAFSDQGFWRTLVAEFDRASPDRNAVAALLMAPDGVDRALRAMGDARRALDDRAWHRHRS